MRSVCLFLPLLLACGKGPFGGQSAAAGFVFESTGAGAAGVTVSGGGGSTATDATGRFDLAIAGEGRTVLTFAAPGRAPVYRAVEPRGSDLVSVFVVLPPAPLITTIDVTAGPADVFAGPAVIQFPQGSIATAGGATPAGPVDVMVTVIPADQALTFQPFPLVDTEGPEALPLVSYGMVDVQLSYQGEPARLAPGREAALFFPAPAGAPAEVGLYHGDPAQGRWVLEGLALNDGASYSAVLPHLSWWNVDKAVAVTPAEKACVRLRFLAPDGSPLSGVEVHPVWQGGLTLIGTSEEDGTLCYDCYSYGAPIAFWWSVMLGRSSRRMVTGIEYVTPAGPGGSCSGECQEAVITVACAADDECAAGDRCVAGLCLGGGGPGDAPWIGVWHMLSIDGMQTSTLGWDATLTMSASAFSHFSSTITVTCTVSGIITDADGDSMVQTSTQTDCPGDTPGRSWTMGWSISSDLLTLTGPSVTVWERVSP